jgi:hypothetical protein
MADKTPVRVVFNASNVATGMAEFQTGESVPVTNGGTGLTAVGSAGQVLKVNAAGNALEFGAEGDISITNLVAPTNSDLTLTTSGTGNIVLDAITFRGTTISSADSTIININEGVVIDGTLNTSGQATLSGLAYPTSDGTVGQFLKTDGSGTLAFADLSLGDLTIIGSTISVPSNADFILDPSGTGAIKLNANTDITGNLTVTGTLDLSDSNFTNVGSLQLDSIAGDGDTNTSITFSGSDVITIATGGSTALTVNADQTVTFSGAVAGTSADFDGGVTIDNITIDGTQIDLSSGDLTIDVAGDLILEAGADVNIPANIGLTFGDDGEKIEGDGTNLLISSSGTATITATGSTVVTNNLTVGGNLDVTGTLDLSDSNFTNVGSLQLDSIAGDGDTNTSITFSGSDVITIATGGSTAATFNADQSASLSGALTVTGVTTLTGGVSTNSVTGEVIPGKQAGTNFPNSLIVGHSTTGTLSGNATTQGKNTAVGLNSMTALTSGHQNTMLGAFAGQQLTTGVNNLFIGAVAGQNGTTHNSNTYVGTNAGTNATGSEGVALGYGALFNSTGSRNIAIGQSAGDNITSGAGNVIIGTTIDPPSATGDRQLVIAGFDGTNTTTWISGDSSGKVSFPGGDGSGIGILSNTISTAASNADINITPHGTGGVVITSGGTTFNLPTSDGSAGQALVTDGSGTLSFDTVSTTTSSDTRAIIKNNKTVNTSARTVDYFQAAAFDMAWYFVALNDMTNDNTSGSVFTVCHNNSDAFIGVTRGGSAGSTNAMPTTSADIASSQVRVKITGPSADSKISFYKIPISRASTSDATAGVTVTTSNTDVDSASESIDTFAHASFRAAKYVILIDDNAKTETGVTEALVVHDGTNAFVAQYGTLQTGNNDMITLSVAISGSNVVLSAAGLTPNLSLKIHKTLLADSMTAESNANQKIIGATTVSSTATAFDSFDLDDATAAVYYVVGKNSTEGAYSVQEVYLSGDIGEAGVSSGPFVSSKATTQLEFTADFLDTTDNTVQLSISSTSGGSTTVNAYRINCLAGE